MRRITVDASKNYDILIGAGFLNEFGKLIHKTCGGHTAAIIADDNVAALYAEQMTSTLKESGYRTALYVFPNGEFSKNADTFLCVADFLVKEKLTRTDIVVALGGGVTGDLAGFAAACYMRGIGFVQIPTTLLAAVDSSVGGKTAVNLSCGKNLLGAFYQPDLVLCDVSLFSTLTREVYRDGCAEIIKYGVIADSELFNSLKSPIDTQLEETVARCVAIKRDIVAEDEFEHGSRKLLNFGHTIGHAIEHLSGYCISHGHAVAAGMAIVTRAAVKMGMCGESCLNALVQMLKRYELPTTTSFNAEELACVCLSDKKRDGDNLTMIFPVEIGKCILKEIPINEVESVIKMGLG